MSIYQQSPIKTGYQTIFNRLETIFQPLVMLGLRWQIAMVFLASGMTKWLGFMQFNPDAYDIFLYEFFCPEEPRPGALLLCDPVTLDYIEGSFTITLVESLAYMAGVMEIILPIMLIIGLCSRFAALGLLAMTLFIQLAVFPEWSHWVNPASWWAAVSAAIIVAGPGALSIDRLIGLEKGRK